MFKRKTTTVDGIIGALASTVAQLQDHATAKTAECEAIEDQIAEMDQKADAAAQEAMRAEVIAFNIGSLINPSADSDVNPSNED